MSQIYKSSSGGGGSGIETIDGDIGSITGANVTIFANNATNTSGGTVLFDNSGTVSTFKVTDVVANTFVGQGCGNNLQNSSENTGFGGACLGSIGNLSANNSAFGIAALGSFVGSNVDGSNIAFGQSCLGSLVDGNSNASFGRDSGENLVSGNFNLFLGNSAADSFMGSESSNIIIGSEGVIGDNNTIRIGEQGSGDEQQDTTFIAGIVGVTVSNEQLVTIDSATGQLGVRPVANSTFFQAYRTSNQTVAGGNASTTIIFDTAISNVGAAYNTATGVFTAPDTGFYSFSSTVFFDALTGPVGLTQIILGYTGSVQSLRLEQFGLVPATTGAALIITASWSMPMTAGDTVQMQPFADGAGNYIIAGAALASGAFNTASTFSGFRVA